MLSVEELEKKYTTAQILILLLTRLHLKKVAAAEVQAYIDRQPLDWSLFYKTAAAHHVRAFLFTAITTHHLRIDAQTETQLKQYALLTNVNSLHQARFQQQLLAEFEALGVKAIPYKGVTFAQRYYPSMGSRESSDLDFLVPESSVAKLRSYFHQKGYQPKQDVAGRYLNYIIATAKELSFKTPPDALGINCSVEIQWKLMENFVGRFPAYDFFAPHLKAGQGKSMPGLTPTYDFICMASHHFVREPLTRFKYLVDAACLIVTHEQELDMQLVAGVFKQYGYAGFFSSAMQALEQLLGITVEGFTAKDAHASSLLQHVLAYPVIDKIEFSNAQNLSLLFRFMPGKWAKAKLAARIGWYSLLPGFGDLQEFKLPAYFLPLLVITRPYRLLMDALNRRKEKQAAARAIQPEA